jgi:hypothetical protein
MRSLLSLRRLRWFSVTLVFFLACVAEEKAPLLPTPPTIDPIQVMPAAAAAAEKLGIAVKSLQFPSSDSASPNIGDTVTFAVDSIDSKTRREWIVQLLTHEIKPEEKKRVIPEHRIFVSTGREVVFPSSVPEGIAIRILGPYQEGKGAKGAKDIWSGALVNGQFLRIGLNGTPGLFNRLTKQKELEEKQGMPKTTNVLTASFDPFTKDVLALGRSTAEHYKITEAEERSLAAFMPAVLDFFNIAAQTTGVRDILFEIVEIPWWKLMINGGRIKNLFFNIIQTGEEWPSEQWGLPPGGTVRGFGLLVYLEQKPSMLFRVIVATPRPPLQASAGILAIAASRPDGKGSRLVLRMVGAKAP